jgi:hypothetical protein
VSWRRGFVGALGRGFETWKADYMRFAWARGFRSFNDWQYHRRGFLECWAEPDFHRFWQAWNPGIAYFVYRLYLTLGGRRRWAGPTVLAFTLSGIAHTIVLAPLLRQWSCSLIVTFTLFGLLAIVSRRLRGFLRQDRWPRLVNLGLNVALVIGSFDAGFRADAWLC